MDLPSHSIALVTGAAGGIGAASAIGFAKEGVRAVVIVDISKERLAATAAECERIATNAKFETFCLGVDISQEEEVIQMIKITIEKFGRLDFAHNNAGVSNKHNFTDFPLAEYDRVLNVNLRGTFICMREESKVMLRQEPLETSFGSERSARGVIVNTASLATYRGFRRNAAYTSSKHGVGALTKTMAIELAGQGIRVNAICPGFVDTPLHHNSTEQTRLLTEGGAKCPIGRVAVPEEISDVVLFLCSPRASYLQGALITVDGGFMC